MLVLDPAIGRAGPGRERQRQARPLDRPEAATIHAATTEAATNKLFHAAHFELGEPGLFAVEVVIEGAKAKARVRFEMEVAEGRVRRMDLWPWIGWPAPVILLYGVHQWLVWRKSRPVRPTIT